MSEIIRVAVVDDHPMIRGGVTMTLGRQADIEVVAEGENGDDAIRIANEHLPDVMLLDLSMPGGGIECARRIATDCPAVRIVMLTVSEDEGDVTNALAAGARGYLLKGVSGPDLVSAVRSIHSGNDYVSPGLAARLLVDQRRQREESETPEALISKLNHREEQILLLVAEGLSNREIAEQLSLAEKTVKHYMTNILQKLHVTNRVKAALLASNIKRK